jgi:hypothetical protein
VYVEAGDTVEVSQARSVASPEHASAVTEFGPGLNGLDDVMASAAEQLESKGAVPITSSPTKENCAYVYELQSGAGT